MTKAPTKPELLGALRATTHLNVALEERLAALEFALEDVGYRRLSMEGEREFSRDALDAIALACRMSYLKNPLINHAVEIQTDYVFGTGVTVSAKDDRINEVIQAFWDDPKNKAEFTSPAEMPLHEVSLLCEGNDFLTLFTDTLGTGAVHIRSIPFTEIRKIICDPQDGKTPWYYRREWTEITTNPESGEEETKPRVAYYADWRYESTATTFGGKEVIQDAKIMHVKVGAMKDMKFGVPEMYAAVDWAKAVVDDLSLDMTIKRAQARFANALYVTGGDTAVQNAKSKLNTTVSPSSGQESKPPPLTASTFIADQAGARWETITNRNTMSADSGRPLRLMTGAAAGLPETMMVGDSDVGNYATAKTLDRPTELKMTRRQTLWKGVIDNLIQYVVKSAVEAVQGSLRDLATIEEHPITKEKVVVWKDAKDALQEPHADQTDDEHAHESEPRDTKIEISFPNVVEHDPEIRQKQAMDANTHGAMTDRTAARIMLSANGVEDVDDELERLGLTEDAPPTGSLGAPEVQSFDDEGKPVPIVRNAPAAMNGNGKKPHRDRLAAALAELVAENLEQNT